MYKEGEAAQPARFLTRWRPRRPERRPPFCRASARKAAVGRRPREAEPPQTLDGRRW